MTFNFKKGSNIIDGLVEEIRSVKEQVKINEEFLNLIVKIAVVMYFAFVFSFVFSYCYA